MANASLRKDEKQKNRNPKEKAVFYSCPPHLSHSCEFYHKLRYIQKRWQGEGYWEFFLIRHGFTGNVKIELCYEN